MQCQNRRGSVSFQLKVFMEKVDYHHIFAISPLQKEVQDSVHSYCTICTMQSRLDWEHDDWTRTVIMWTRGPYPRQPYKATEWQHRACLSPSILNRCISFAKSFAICLTHQTAGRNTRTDVGLEDWGSQLGFRSKRCWHSWEPCWFQGLSSLFTSFCKQPETGETERASCPISNVLK